MRNDNQRPQKIVKQTHYDMKTNTKHITQKDILLAITTNHNQEFHTKSWPIYFVITTKNFIQNKLVVIGCVFIL
jgi:hypothetical protein